MNACPLLHTGDFPVLNILWRAPIKDPMKNDTFGALSMSLSTTLLSPKPTVSASANPCLPISGFSSKILKKLHQ